MIYVRSDRPVPPADVADAVIRWFRDRGRNAVVEWIPGMNCFAALVSLRTNDPLLGAWNEGKLGGERVPSEDVFFHEPNPHPQAGKVRRDAAGKIVGIVPIYRALDLGQLGVSGITTFLEKGNVQSGRGEFKSLADAASRAREQHRAGVEKIKTEQRDLAADKAKDLRRQINKTPFHRVGIDLQQPPQPAAAERH